MREDADAEEAAADDADDDESWPELDGSEETGGWEDMEDFPEPGEAMSA